MQTVPGWQLACPQTQRPWELQVLGAGQVLGEQVVVGQQEDEEEQSPLASGAGVHWLPSGQARAGQVRV